MDTLFQQHAVLIALVCGAATVIYGLLLIRWVLAKPAGNDQMREIAAAERMAPIRNPTETFHPPRSGISKSSARTTATTAIVEY